MPFGHEVGVVADLDFYSSGEGMYDLMCIMEVFGEVDHFPPGLFDKYLVICGFVDGIYVIYLRLEHIGVKCKYFGLIV